MPRGGGKVYHNFDTDTRLTTPISFTLGGEKHELADLSDDLLQKVEELANLEDENSTRVSHSLSMAVAMFVVDPDLPEEEYDEQFNHKVELFDGVAIKFKQAAMDWIQEQLQDPLGKKRQQPGQR